MHTLINPHLTMQKWVNIEKRKSSSFITHRSNLAHVCFDIHFLLICLPASFTLVRVLDMFIIQVYAFLNKCHFRGSVLIEVHQTQNFPFAPMSLTQI